MKFLLWIVGAVLLLINAPSASFTGLSLLGWALVAVSSLMIINTIGEKE